MNVVYLKKNGKAYACADCGERPHRLLVQPSLYSRSELRCYECLNTKCMRQVPTTGFEAQLPPRNDWRTPGGSVMEPEEDGLFTTLHREYGFNLDVAANDKNKKTPLYYDEKYSSFDYVWFGAPLADRARALGLPRSHHDFPPESVRVWDNCPYKPVGEVERWLERALQMAAEGVFSVHLIPMSTSTAWFNDLVVPYAEWHSFRGRIQFEDPLAPQDSDDDERVSPKQDNLLVIYDPNSTVVGHTAVRHAKTGKKLWTRPDLLRS